MLSGLSVGNWKANMKVVLALLGIFVTLATLDFGSSESVCGIGKELFPCMSTRGTSYQEYLVAKNVLKKGKCPRKIRRINKLIGEKTMVSESLICQWRTPVTNS